VSTQMAQWWQWLDLLVYAQVMAQWWYWLPES
jgi:hypothetical protein